MEFFNIPLKSFIFIKRKTLEMFLINYTYLNK